MESPAMMDAIEEITVEDEPGKSSAGISLSCASGLTAQTPINYGTSGSNGAENLMNDIPHHEDFNNHMKHAVEVQVTIKDGITSEKRESKRRRSSRKCEDVEPWQPGPGDRPMYDGADMPTTDLPEDHHGPEPQPMPLDVSRLSRISGYEGVGYYAHSVSIPAIAPPNYTADHLDKQKPPEETFSSVSHIKESQAREALLHYAAEKCCYGKSAAKDMLIHKITPSSALHYTLETYTETRATTWDQEPYQAQAIDGPDIGPPPPPWEIKCNPTQMFHDEVRKIEVPHTATILSCHGCQALGWVRCHGCMGRGFKRCMYCHGTGRIWKTDAHGHRHPETCWHCHGTGRKRCLACGGDGRVVCKTCSGFRQLKCYISLTVTYTNHEVEQIVEHTGMPDHLITEVGGELVFEQTQPTVWPISTYPDMVLCRSSQRIVNDQLQSYPNSRVIMQRQKLRAVPVCECLFNYRDQEGRFWVYGHENAVYAPDYPQKCCWGCVLL